MAINAALILAHSSEASLSSNELGILIKAQGSLAEHAFPYCIQQTKQLPVNFTVVVKINHKGKATDSWLDVNEPFAVCFRSEMVKSFKYTPKPKNFFTAFEYANDEPYKYMKWIVFPLHFKTTTYVSR
jgi:hypothetical protein